jgi:homoserine dehydrogenase
MNERIVKVAFLGLGNIGGGVFTALRMNSEGIAHREGVRFELKKALVRDLDKPRPEGIRQSVLTTDIDDILADPEIELAAEFLGGIEPAFGYMQKLLLAGKSVVTANKEVIAHRWPELEQAARSGGAGLYYEASVCGGIPVIKTINESLQANEISDIKGIINGTTNHMLSRMSSAGITYDEALGEAQRSGLAEPDPTNDVGGHDAACKLSILASIAFHAKVPVNRVFREGITRVSPADIALGRELGYAIKLLAIGKKRGHTIEARVHPTFIPREHPLSAVSGAYNAVHLEGNAVGSLMLYGRGAGDLPTASAVISDMITAAKAASHRYNTFENTPDASSEVEIATDWDTRYFLHLEVMDKPGVLADIAGALAKRGVSIASCVQKGWEMDVVPIYIITHRTRERAMMEATEDIRHLGTIVDVAGLIRVEE